jgi:hypothetical protein
MTPSLLKKSSLTPSSSGAGTSSLTTERTSHHDAWRTMVMLQAISELWLSHVTSKENSNLQAGSSPRSQVNVLQVLLNFLNYYETILKNWILNLSRLLSSSLAWII